MRAKISMIAVNMTAYPSVRKPALEAPEPVELEFARDTPGALDNGSGHAPGERREPLWQVFTRIFPAGHVWQQSIPVNQHRKERLGIKGRPCMLFHQK
jgi:hypothetical protein